MGCNIAIFNTLLCINRIMKHILVIFILLHFLNSTFSQEKPLQSTDSYIYSAGTKMIYFFRDAIYYESCHFGNYKYLVEPTYNFSITASAFVIPQKLRYDMEVPISIFYNKSYKEISGGSSVGLSYFFLNNQRSGVHLKVGSSIKSYKIDNNNLLIFPILVGMEVHKKHFLFNLSYSRNFQIANQDYRFFNNFFETGISYQFGKDELKSNIAKKKDNVEMSVGFSQILQNSEISNNMNFSAGYHFNSKYSVLLSYQKELGEKYLFEKNNILLDVNRKFNGKRLVSPYFGVTIGYSLIDEENIYESKSKVICGLNAGIQINTKINPNIIVKSGLRVITTFTDYSDYLMNHIDFNLLQLGYLF